MKNVKKAEWIAYIGYFLLGLTIGLVFLGLGNWIGSLFVLLPLPLTLFLYLTFFLTLRGKKDIGLALYTCLRIMLVLVMIAAPAAIWYFVPALHEAVSAFFLIASPVETLAVYILALVFVFLDRRFRE